MFIRVEITTRKIYIKINGVATTLLYKQCHTLANCHLKGSRDSKKLKIVIIFFNLADVPMAVKQKEIMYADVTLTWDEPANNGANITQYYIYQRIAGDDQWKRLAVLTDLLKREYVVEVEKDKGYEFAVTAGNIYGESSKDNIETVKLSQGMPFLSLLLLDRLLDVVVQIQSILPYWQNIYSVSTCIQVESCARSSLSDDVW